MHWRKRLSSFRFYSAEHLFGQLTNSILHRNSSLLPTSWSSIRLMILSRSWRHGNSSRRSKSCVKVRTPLVPLGYSMLNLDLQCKTARMTRTLSRHQVSCLLNALYLPCASRCLAALSFAHTTNASMHIHFLNYKSKLQLGPALCVPKRPASNLSKSTSKSISPWHICFSS